MKAPIEKKIAALTEKYAKAGYTAAEIVKRIEAELTADEIKYAQGFLPVTGKVKIKASDASAKAEYNHLVTADASARGGDTAIGGAFIVTWIGDNARAELNQSLSATKAVSITSSTDSALKAVAKAAVSSGMAGKNDEKTGKGGADKQAD